MTQTITQPTRAYPKTHALKASTELTAFDFANDA